jgi:hypothetical protein
LLADELVVTAPAQAGHARPGQGRLRVNGGVLEVEGDLWPATNPELASALMACRATVLFERGVARARLPRLTDAAEGTRAAALATALAEYLGSHRADALSPRGDAMDASKRAQ